LGITLIILRTKNMDNESEPKQTIPEIIWGLLVQIGEWLEEQIGENEPSDPPPPHCI